MTEQEKELKDLLIKEYSCMGCDMITRQEQDSLIDDWAETLGEALIQRYPQILAEKVWEGNQSDFLVGMWDQQIKFKGKNVQVFIREVVE